MVGYTGLTSCTTKVFLLRGSSLVTNCLQRVFAEQPPQVMFHRILPTALASGHATARRARKTFDAGFTRAPNRVPRLCGTFTWTSLLALCRSSPSMVVHTIHWVSKTASPNALVIPATSMPPSVGGETRVVCLYDPIRRHVGETGFGQDGHGKGRKAHESGLLDLSRLHSLRCLSAARALLRPGLTSCLLQ